MKKRDCVRGLAMPLAWILGETQGSSSDERRSAIAHADPVAHKKGRILKKIRPIAGAMAQVIRADPDQVFEYLPPVWFAMGSSPFLSRSRRVSRTQLRFKSSFTETFRRPRPPSTSSSI